MNRGEENGKILRARNLSMAFGGLVVFDNISLDISSNQIVALIGPNGAGKTTLIKCITGVYKPTRGDIVFQGFDQGVVYLHMRGACAGCPSSTATLKMGIENMLRHYVPEVIEVRAVN